MAAMSVGTIFIEAFPTVFIDRIHETATTLSMKKPPVNAWHGCNLVHITSRQRYQEMPAECPSPSPFIQPVFQGSGPTARWNAKVGWSGRRLAGGRPPKVTVGWKTAETVV